MAVSGYGKTGQRHRSGRGRRVSPGVYLDKTTTRGSVEILNYVKPYVHQPDDVLQEILNLQYVILETSV